MYAFFHSLVHSKIVIFYHAYKALVLFVTLCLFMACGWGLLWKKQQNHLQSTALLINTNPTSEQPTAAADFIKWVDFQVSYEALEKAYQYDVDSHEQAVPLDWISLLAYAAARCGGDIDQQDCTYIDDAAEKLQAGHSMEELTTDMDYYAYYKEAYQAVLAGYVGTYKLQLPDGKYETCYGLKAFSPIAKGFPYRDYDDFGVSRSYGFRRQHLGHDMMGQIGTPIIAVESGYVEVLGWNQYGGWRIGIRSFDQKRYYYYAHLRQNYPYAEDLEEGDLVTAGDVIGYMGHTGYSSNENVNNIDEVHLHFGIQLIFDESQKDCNCEIWINPYSLVRFLSQNQSQTEKKEPEGHEWVRTTLMIDPSVSRYKESRKKERN